MIEGVRDTWRGVQNPNNVYSMAVKLDSICRMGFSFFNPELPTRQSTHVQRRIVANDSTNKPSISTIFHSY